MVADMDAGLTDAGTDTGAGGDSMVFVSVSETYDLSTKKGKMSLIGIHTPTKNIIQKTYPGLLMNSKFVRISHCDVVMGCASILPADPLQVGVSAGEIAPQDMFNPILYKAVSNESMSTLEARLQGLNYTSTANSASGPSVTGTNEEVTGSNSGIDEFSVYYTLLSNRDGFRTANPQSGLEMRGLKPLVFEKYYNNAINQNFTDVTPSLGVDANGQEVLLNSSQYTKAMRGNAHPMPKMNTTYLTAPNGGSGTSQPNGMGDGTPLNINAGMPDILPVYVAVILLPPAKLNELYYRLQIRWYLEFTEVRPMSEITGFDGMAFQIAPVVYHTDYAVQSAKLMSSTNDMADANNAEISKIMEGA